MKVTYPELVKPLLALNDSEKVKMCRRDTQMDGFRFGSETGLRKWIESRWMSSQALYLLTDTFMKQLCPRSFSSCSHGMFIPTEAQDASCFHIWQ